MICVFLLSCWMNLCCVLVILKFLLVKLFILCRFMIMVFFFFNWLINWFCFLLDIFFVVCNWVIFVKEVRCFWKVVVEDVFIFSEVRLSWFKFWKGSKFFLFCIMVNVCLMSFCFSVMVCGEFRFLEIFFFCKGVNCCSFIWYLVCSICFMLILRLF